VGHLRPDAPPVGVDPRLSLLSHRIVHLPSAQIFRIEIRIFSGFFYFFQAKSFLKLMDHQKIGQKKY
jgi:hypothetical protein